MGRCGYCGQVMGGDNFNDVCTACGPKPKSVSERAHEAAEAARQLKNYRAQQAQWFYDEIVLVRIRLWGSGWERLSWEQRCTEVLAQTCAHLFTHPRRTNEYAKEAYEQWERDNDPRRIALNRWGPAEVSTTFCMVWTLVTGKAGSSARIWSRIDDVTASGATAVRTETFMPRNIPRTFSPSLPSETWSHG